MTTSENMRRRGRTMTPERLSEIRKLCDAATPGEWVATPSNAFYTPQDAGTGQPPGKIIANITGNNQGDTEFISAARQAIPELLDEVERLTAIVEKLPRREMTTSEQENMTI